MFRLNIPAEKQLIIHSFFPDYKQTHPHEMSCNKCYILTEGMLGLEDDVHMYSGRQDVVFRLLTQCSNKTYKDAFCSFVSWWRLAWKYVIKNLTLLWNTQFKLLWNSNQFVYLLYRSYIDLIEGTGLNQCLLLLDWVPKLLF